MKKIITQIAKFGIIGLLAAVMDFSILNFLITFLHMNAALAGTISFTISLIFNYLASMKYVFVHREDMARWMELLIFVLSAVIGLLINILILWIAAEVLLPAGTQSTDPLRYSIYTNVGKVFATVVVAVWNFCVRKWLLDAPSGDGAKNTNSFSHKIGMWSLEVSKKK